MKIPKSIKVLSVNYKVKLVSKEWKEEAEAYGLCNKDEAFIKLTKKQPLSIRLDTAIHELFHAVYHNMSILDEEKEEAIVSRMATGWVSVMRDNPAFCRWMYEALAKLEAERTNSHT
jgi:Zn-dependent peptidase ImmA (M78 family)